MEQSCYYDKKENVIFLEFAYYATHPKENAFEDIVRVSNSLPEKVYLVVNWTGVKYLPEGLDLYSKALSMLDKYVKGVVRYGFTDSHTRVKVRAETIKQDFQGSKANIFDTKEEALAAIRAGKM